VKKHQYQILTALIIVVGIYLFVSAPPPIPNGDTSAQQIALKWALEIINNENKIVRSLYTKRIVGAGKKSGIKFQENWEDQDIQAGPLPAQFLRLTATSLEKSSQPLGLYLGSDFPINKANRFKGKQATVFDQLKRSQKPHFFYIEDIKRYTYMFADIAISKGCVNCHNKHKDTPKSNWKLNDIMGATTWTYPDESISLDTFFSMLHELRNSFKFAYSSFINKIKKFDSSPTISDKWPKDGYFLPSVSVFTTEINKRASPQTLLLLTKYLNDVKRGIIDEKAEEKIQ